MLVGGCCEPAPTETQDRYTEMMLRRFGSMNSKMNSGRVPTIAAAGTHRRPAVGA
jgi:hypothetical protein